MDKLGIKATLYDFFAYLLPGICTIFVIKIFILNIASEFDYKDILNLFVITNIYQFLILLILSYISGHLISTISSILIEKNIVKKIQRLNNYFKISNLLSNDIYRNFEENYKMKFNSKFNEKDFRLIVCYVEENHKENYSTSFVFLCFYGMARNISFVFFLTFLFEMSIIFYTKTFQYYSLIYILIGIISFFHYLRFKKYFITNIINSFLIDTKK